jgi:hypothetical protein
MITGDKLVLCLAVLNGIIALAYALDGQWAKMTYWLSAAGINLSLVMMR